MLNNVNKSILQNSSVYNHGAIFRQLQYGEVVSTDDNTGMGRIKVRITGNASVGGDKEDIAIEDLPFCFPLLPKHLSVIPKVGDMTWIFVFDKNTQFADRLYLGPIVSQLDKLGGEDAKTSALRGMSFSTTRPDVNIADIPDLKGVFPNKEDISIQGRDNTEMTLKPNEILIRAGKFETNVSSQNNPYKFKFNRTSQAYIQIKNNALITRTKGTPFAPELGSITTIVANKINLLTHKDGSPRYNITDQDGLISEEEMLNILNSAHQLPFGDILLEYLKLLKEAFLNHVHNGSGKAPTDLVSSGNKLPVGNFVKRAKELEEAMLSKNIRIN